MSIAVSLTPTLPPPVVLEETGLKRIPHTVDCKSSQTLFKSVVWPLLQWCSFHWFWTISFFLLSAWNFPLATLQHSFGFTICKASGFYELFLISFLLKYSESRADLLVLWRCAHSSGMREKWSRDQKGNTCQVSTQYLELYQCCHLFLPVRTLLTWILLLLVWDA